MSWTQSQQVAIAVAPKVSGFLSIIGSCCIIYDIVRFQLQRTDVNTNNTTVTMPADEVESNCFSVLPCCANKSTGTNTISLSNKTSTFTSILTTSSAHHRIILGMSISDCIISTAHFFSTWPIPRSIEEEFPSFGNIGNTMTCSAQGFFIQLGIMVPLYNSLLVLYFVLTIRRGWTESQFQQYVGPIGHSLIWIFGLGTAVAGLFLRLYNNATIWCWIASSPQGCVQSFQPPEQDYSYDSINGSTNEPCERGDNAFIYRFAFWYGPLWLMFPWVVIGMSLVYLHVLKQDKKMESYLNDYTDKVANLHKKEMQTQNPRNSCHEDSDDVKDSDQQRDDNPAVVGQEPSESDLVSEDTELEAVEPSNNKHASASSHEQAIQIANNLRRSTRVRSRAVALQGIFYMLAFLATYSFPTIVRSLQLAEIPPDWFLFFMFALLKPLQGLMNWFVYFRPRLFPASRNNGNASSPFQTM
jgi:hypothetical protein